MRIPKTIKILNSKNGILDLKISFFMVFLLFFYIKISGDYLFVGSWYYLITLLVGVFFGIITYPRPFFLSGAILALVLTLWFYIQISMTSERPEGLLILGHVFSLPGAYLGLLASAMLIKKIHLNSLATFMFAVVGTLTGFLANQAVICSSLMRCS